MSILDNAVENDVIHKNPLRKVKSPKTIKKVTMNDTDTDIDRKLYNLRHTFASQLISKGEDITWVSKTLGHESVQTTLKYYTKYIKKKKMQELKIF